MPIETGCVTKRRCDSRTPYESKVCLLTMSLSFSAFASVVGRTVTDSDRLKAALWRNFLRFRKINASNYDPIACNKSGYFEPLAYLIDIERVETS